MTKEIIYRQDVLDLAKKGVLISNGNYESVCKAINGLPLVTPQPCEDAIDRAKAIMIASGYCHPANVAKELAKLPSVNPQPCKDAISRQASIDFINNHLPFRASNEVYDAYADCVRMLGDNKALPPVTPQPKIGHWIWEVSSHKCSACNEYTCFEDSKPPKYCPNCGARMVEPQERSDKE